MSIKFSEIARFSEMLFKISSLILRFSEYWIVYVILHVKVLVSSFCQETN